MKYKGKCPVCGGKVSLSYFFSTKVALFDNHSEPEEISEENDNGMIWECNSCDFKEDAGSTVTTKTFQNTLKTKLNKAIRKLESGKFTISDYLKLEKDTRDLKL